MEVSSLVGASSLGSAASSFICGFGTEVVVLGFFRSVGWCWDFYLCKFPGLSQ